MDEKTINEFVEMMKKDYGHACLHYCFIKKAFVIKEVEDMFNVFCKGKEAGQKLSITKSFSNERFDPHAR